MKKIVYASGVLAALSLTLFTGCKKVNEGPFPAKPQSNGTYQDFSYTTPYFPTLGDADGILISAQVYNEKTEIVSGFYNTYEYGMAKFASGTGNFNTLVDAGNVTLNDSVLAKSSALSYLSSISNFTLNLSSTIAWNVSGNSANGTPAITYTLNPASNPTYSNTINNWDSKWAPIYPRTLYAVPARPPYTHLNSISTAADTAGHIANLPAITLFLKDSAQHTTDSVYNATVQYSIPIKGYTANTDTLIIAMIDGAGFSYIRKVAPAIAADSVANFRPNDFAGYPSYNIGSFTLQINAIKYNWAMINSKKYYFLQMNSNVQYFGATR